MRFHLIILQGSVHLLLAIFYRRLNAMKKYENLKKRYPQYISLDDFHKIAHIAKRSAKYLVENGIVPAIDTGKQTWRYKIHIDDAIAYLQQRDKAGSMIPKGAVSPCKGIRKRSFSQALAAGQEKEVAEYFRQILSAYPDVLSTANIADITGFNKKSVMRIIGCGHIKYIARGRKYLIPKPYFLEYVVTPRFIEAWSNSERFIKVLTEFEEWIEQR
jgi:hypothetical protein